MGEMHAEWTVCLPDKAIHPHAASLAVLLVPQGA
jgi:hypothetical protein